MSTPRTLFLHVGHGKTGSSYLQSCLAASVEILGENGVAYPATQKELRAAQGVTSSGNGHLLLEHIGRHDEVNRMLFSSEFFCRDLVEDNRIRHLRHWVDSDHTNRIEILLFIRNPVDYAVSAYQQRVKKGDETRTLDEAALLTDQPTRVHRFIEAMNTLPRTTLTVWNYSTCRDRIVDIVEDWISLPRGTFARPPVDVVNRSLTVGELYLQLAINRSYSHAQSRLTLAKHLVKDLPRVPADAILPSIDTQEKVWAMLATDIEAVNRVVPAHARYDVEMDIRPPTRNEMTLSQEQLASIGKYTAILLRDAVQLEERLRERVEQERQLKEQLQSPMPHGLRAALGHLPRQVAQRIRLSLFPLR